MPSKKPFISIVDDHEGFRVSLCQLLDTLGYPSKAYGSVVEFIKSNAVRQTDCLILDVGMPEIDGFALQKCISDTNYEVPIIFCTGLDDDEAKERALANGAVHFLQKPVKPAVLAEAILSACEVGRKRKAEK
jgi:FixJ family two-component response regulator